MSYKMFHRINVMVILVITFCVLLGLCSVQADAAIIGNNGAGSAGSDQIGANYLSVFRFQASSNMTVTKMYVKLSQGSSTGAIKLGIYSDVSGSPGSFLKGTSERSALGTGWQAFNLTSGQALTSGTYYWLAVWCNSWDYTVAYDNGGTGYYKSFTYGATFPSSYGTGGNGFSLKYCLYAEDVAVTSPTATASPTPTATATATTSTIVSPTTSPTSTATVTSTVISTVSPTATVTSTSTLSPSPSGETNIALNGTGYRWSQNTTDTANTNRVAASGVNDNNKTADVELNGGSDDNSNAWEAAGVVWTSVQATVTRVEFKNGSYDSGSNGVFTANFKLQFSADGSTWTNATWNVSPVYSYDSSSAAGVTYVFTGSGGSNLRGVRVVGQVHTGVNLSWHAHAAELSVFAGGVVPTPTPTVSPTVSPSATPTLSISPTLSPSPTPTLSPTATLSPTTTPGGRYMGLNVGFAADWEGNLMFADAMKSCRTFRNIADTADATVDSVGWPTQDFQVILWHGITRMNGTYAFSFNGQATVSIGLGSASLSAINYNSSTNTSTATLTYSGTNDAGLSLSFTNTKRTSSSATNTGLTNVKLMRPTTQGATTSYPVGKLMTDQFMNIVTKFKVCRYMDYSGTNSKTAEAEWSQRVLPGWPSQQPAGGIGYGWQGKGGAWEYIILMSNETNTDPWICVPVAASDDYVTKLARLFRYGSDGVNPYSSTQSNPVYPPLNSNLKLYVEFSNELWNTAGAFSQSGWNKDKAVAEVNAGGSILNYDGENGDWQLGWRRQAKRTVEISNIFRSVFGDSAMMTQVRPVLEWQQDNGQNTAGVMLNFIDNWYNNGDGNHVANPHPVNYYIWGGCGSAYYNPDNESNSLTIDNIWTSDTNNTANWASAQKTDATWASSFGLRRTAYEGGEGMDNTGHSEAVKEQSWGDPRMKTCVIDHQKFWEQYGGDLLMYFTIGGTDGSGYYQWNMAKNIHDAVNTSPKLQAIDTLNTGSVEAVTLGTLIPGTREGNAWDLYSGWGTPGSGSLDMSSTGTRWATYNFRNSYAGTYSVIVNYSASGAAVLDVNLRGIKVGSINATAGSNQVFTVNGLSLPAGLQGLRLLCKSGSITINSVRMQ